MDAPARDSGRAGGAVPPTGRTALDIAAIPGLEELWAETTGDPRVCVAVLDGPVDLNHSSLSGARLRTVRNRPAEACTGAACRHGTHVASVLFGQPGGPVQGIAPHCSGLLVPIFNDGANGSLPSCSQDDLGRAILDTLEEGRQAVEEGALILNISAGQPTTAGQASELLREAIRACVRQRVLVVAAAGNEGCADCLHYPGALPSVLAVGGMDESGKPLDFSNWGETYRTQGVLAPAKNVRGARPGEGTTVDTGTSLATPIVSGVVALLLSLQLKRGRKADPFAVREAILRGAEGCTQQKTSECDRLLAGRLRIRQATFLILQGACDMAQATESAATTSSVEPVAGSPEPTNGPAVPVGLPDEGDTSSAVAPSAQVAPADCGCGCGKGGNGRPQYVYVIGQLGYDFGTRIRRMSLQQNFPAGEAFGLDIGDPINLLRYLLGWTDAETKHHFNGNLHDAASFNWLIMQGDCPLYAVRPGGSFGSTGYRELIQFLIDQLGPQRVIDGGIDLECLEGYVHCHSGTRSEGGKGLAPPAPPGPHEPKKGGHPGPQEPKKGGAGEPHETKEGEPGKPHEPKKEDTPEPSSPEAVALALATGEMPSKAAFVALAGTVVGKVQLFTGETVEVICPEMRGTSSWNSERLYKAIGALVPDAGSRALVYMILSRFYEEARNDGKSPQDRAKNFALTSIFADLAVWLGNPIVQRIIGDPNEAAVNGVIVKPSACHRTGAEYDVEVSLYNFENTFRGMAVLANSYDVSDVVPVDMKNSRVFPRR